MRIDDKLVANIARLARLEITPEEAALYKKQLGKILDSMDELKAVDTSKVAPTTSVLGVSDVTREDEAKLYGEIERLLDEAPGRDGPYYKVPKVI